MPNAALLERARTIADLYDEAPFGHVPLAGGGTVLDANPIRRKMRGQACHGLVGHELRKFLTPASC